MKAISRFLILMATSILLVACSGGGNGKPQQVQPPDPPAAPVVTVDADIKQLIFSWDAVSGATHYRLLENPDGHSGFTQTGDDISAGTLSVTKNIAVHLHDWVNALYVVQACNTAGCASSFEVSAADLRAETIGHLEASDPEYPFHRGYPFHRDVAVSDDSAIIAIGANNAAYVFSFDGSDWSGELIIVSFRDPARPVNVALSADGNTLAIGDRWDSSSATGVDGDSNDNSAEGSGAVHLFRFDGTSWTKEAYIKASNTGAHDSFGNAVELSEDGNTLVVGAYGEDSSATGVNGYQDDDSESHSGAAYLFRFDGAAWSQRAYIKPSNTPMSQRFGYSVALSSNGETLAVGAPHEDSCTRQVNGDQYATCPGSRPGDAFGAVYLFRFDAQGWWQQAYIKGRSLGRDYFGSSLAISADGNTLAIGEPSGLALDTFGAYVFRFDGTDWSVESRFDAYLFSDSICGHPPTSGSSIAMNGDATLIVLDGRFLLQFDGTDWVFGDQGRIYPPEDYSCWRGGIPAFNDSGTTLVVGGDVF